MRKFQHYFIDVSGGYLRMFLAVIDSQDGINKTRSLRGGVVYGRLGFTL